MQSVRTVKKFIIKGKKKGYLLLEVVVMIAIISILSVPIYSAFTTSINLKSSTLAYNKKLIGLTGLEKIIKKDYSFNYLASLGEIENTDIKYIISETDSIYKFLDLEDVDISIKKKGEELNITIKNNFIDESLNIRKVKWLDVE